jgi:hypothetical protein
MGSKIYGSSDDQLYEPASVDIHDAVCCEFKDLGEKETPWGRQHQGVLVFQVAEEIEGGDYAGKRKEVRLYFNMKIGTETYPSKIRKIVEKWRGKPFQVEELAEGFDMEVLVGQPCRLDVGQKTNKEGTRTYATVDGIQKAGRKKLKPKDYVPIDERESNGNGLESDDDDDDDTPF